MTLTLTLSRPVFFLLVVVSIFLYFACSREPPSQQPSPDTIVCRRTYERWVENMAGKGKTARTTRTRGGSSAPPSLMLNPTHTRGSSGSVTLSGDSASKIDVHSPSGPHDPLSRQEEGYGVCDSPVALSAPPSAYFSNAPHSSFNASDKK